MSRFIVPSLSPDEEGLTVRVTPQSAGWKYVGFEAYALNSGQSLKKQTGDQEACLVILSGIADIAAAGRRFESVGVRMSVFEKVPPYAVYVPAGQTYSVEARTKLEIAVCTAPGRENGTPRLIAPSDMRIEHRGSGHTERLIHHILPEEAEADSLLVVEVLTPEGHWSSYPPHKHDVDDPPRESYLEETYYYKVQPEHGFAIQRVYTDDRTTNETMAPGNGDVTLVPRGYHPVAAPPGYDVYYLNVMAGPVRAWHIHNDPEHEWLLSRAPQARR